MFIMIIRKENTEYKKSYIVLKRFNKHDLWRYQWFIIAGIHFFAAGICFDELAFELSQLLTFK